MMPKLPYILLVDDDQTTNYLNTMLLKRLAITEQVVVATNGQEALAVLATQCALPGATCPVLVFLDVNMPVMNGLEFLEAYQQLPFAQQRAVVVVMLTTSLHPQDVRRAAQLPVADFLSKPLTQAKIEQVLRKHFASELLPGSPAQA